MPASKVSKSSVYIIEQHTLIQRHGYEQQPTKVCQGSFVMGYVWLVATISFHVLQ